jgi:hypothetical protein
MPGTVMAVIFVLMSVIAMMRHDPNLFYYLLVSNTASLSIAIIPFYIALAKTSFHLTSQAVGNYLILQILGMIVSNALGNSVSPTNGEEMLMILFSSEHREYRP